MQLDSLRHLQTSLARIDEFIRVAVLRARTAGHDPTDALRGLIISPDEVDTHLAGESLPGLWPDDPDIAFPTVQDDDDPQLPFNHLTRVFGLTPVDSILLLLALAPDLDRRYERLYAYLQDDVSQRRLTVNLAMNLLSADVTGRFAVWERFAAHMPLRKHHLIDCVPDPSRSNSVFLSYQIKADHRIVAFLLGDRQPDERLKAAVILPKDEAEIRVPEKVAHPIRVALAESPMIYLEGLPGTGRRETAAALCADVGLPLVNIDLAALRELDVPFTLGWQLALREARLVDGAVLIYGWETALNEKELPPEDLWEALLAYELPVFICGVKTWEPHTVERARRLLRLRLEAMTYADRRRHWEQSVVAYGANIEPSCLDELADKFRFTRAQMTLVVQTAADLAASRGEMISLSDLYAGSHAHSSLRLGRLAKRIVPRFSWDDLILPPDRLMQLQEMSERAVHVHQVHETWGFGKKVALNQGVSALFAGDSGTGKTMSAEVIASELGLVLYQIDLSSVVSKYIGETEKNLSVIFEEAQSSNAILFFDEADALFGKRSEVKDAHDRYANIETAYLLQQIEDYDGVAVMATNLRQNLDEAFTRRLDFMVDFPFPDTEYRYRLWAAHFPPEAPIASEVHLGELAERYRLAGGNIRNAALASAYLAAADGGVITMQHIRHAIRREHQKMGRLLEE